MEILVIGAVIGLVPAAIAQSKGYNFILWWFFGTLLFIVALPAALLMKPDIAAIEQSKLREGMKKCPFCAELIKLEANVCKHCGRGLNREAAERFAVEKGTVCNVVPEQRGVPIIQPEAVPQNLGLLLAMALLVIVPIVIALALKSTGDRAKAVFHRTADVLSSPTNVSDFASAATPTNLTLANFGRIQTGMSRYDVEGILGFGSKTIVENELGQGTDFHATTEALEWQDGLRIVTCMFQNGKLIQKAQAGLE